MTQPQCPLCRGQDCSQVLVRERTPVFQNVVYPTRDQARRATCGTIRLLACEGCGFVFNGAFDPQLTDYGPEYENDQSCSLSFQRHLDDMASRVLNRLEGDGRTIVEIGCGQGVFLERMSKSRGGRQDRFIGFDPSVRTTPDPDDNGIALIPTRYDVSAFRAIETDPDAIVCRHVIEHVPDIILFLKDIRRTIRDDSEVKLFFETPCVNNLVQSGCYWDVFYEHCNYFTMETLSYAFCLAGFQVEKIDHVFSGQYLWLEAVPCRTVACERPNLSIRDALLGFGREEERSISHWHSWLSAATGHLAIWGAGAKGSTFVNVVDPDQHWFECVIDINPRKNNAFVAGSGHEIVSARTAMSRDVDTVIVMNPNYLDEIISTAADMGWKCRFVDAESL